MMKKFYQKAGAFLLACSMALPNLPVAANADEIEPEVQEVNVENIRMSVDPGTYVTDGDTVNFTVELEQMEQMPELGEIYLVGMHNSKEEEGNLEKEHQSIDLTRKADGNYEGSVAAAELSACEWVLSSISFENSKGMMRTANLDSYDPDFEEFYPIYFYVTRDGECEKCIVKNVGLYFYDKDEKEISSITVDLPRRTTLGEVLGEHYPDMENDKFLGEFQGWQSGEICYGKDTPLVHYKAAYTVSSMRFFASYEKFYFQVQYAYLNEDGKTHEEVKNIICEKGQKEEEVLAQLSVPQCGNCKFLGWKERVKEPIEPDNYWYLIAIYDKYPVRLEKHYIDRDGNVKSVVTKKEYPAGTTYEEAAAGIEMIPEDASEEWQITGSHWYRSGDEMGFPSGEIELDSGGKLGSINNSFDFVFEYETKEIIPVYYQYADQEQNWNYNFKRFLLFEKEERENTEAAYKKIAEQAPKDHMEELDFSGEWDIQCYPSEYYMTAKYNNVIIGYSLYDENGAWQKEMVAAGKRGEQKALPKGYVVYTTDENGNSVAENSIYIPEDSEDSMWVSCYRTEEAANIISQIQNAKDSETVEVTLEDGGLSKEALEILQGKDVTVEAALENGMIWKMNGKQLPETGLSDMDLDVKKAAAGEEKIDAKELSALAGTRSIEQLVFYENGELGFAPQLTIAADAQSKGDKAVLLQKAASSAGSSGTGTGEGAGEQLQLAGASLLKDRSVTFAISRKADSAVIYGTNGDTDGDGAVKLTDMMQVLHHVSSRNNLNEVQKGFADVDMNNEVEIQDLMRELHFVSGRSQSVYDEKQ